MNILVIPSLARSSFPMMILENEFRPELSGSGCGQPAELPYLFEADDWEESVEGI